MLILTRRPGETLVIREDIRITVLGFRGMQVRIGVEAPKAISVDRQEVRKRKEGERYRRRDIVCPSSCDDGMVNKRAE